MAKRPVRIIPVRRAIAELWHWQAHEGQREPAGDWRLWVIMAGRGFGKTRAGAEWVSALARADGTLRIALVAATLEEARAVMVEGESGLIAVAHAGERVRYLPSKRTVRFPSGAQAYLYSAERPEALRGPQHHAAWCDELAKWRLGAKTWNNLMLGLRLGARPRTLVTTTPRAGPLLKRLLAEPGVVVAHGRTADNPHLPGAYRTAVETAYAGTRLGRQELDGQLIEEVEGSLWPAALIERASTERHPNGLELARVVVGVDPPAGSGTCGIVVAGVDPEWKRVRAGGRKPGRCLAGALGANRGGSVGAVAGGPRRRRGEQWRGNGRRLPARRGRATAAEAGPCGTRQDGAGGAGRGAVRARGGKAGRALSQAGGAVGRARARRRLSGAGHKPRPGRRDGVGADRTDARHARRAARPRAVTRWPPCRNRAASLDRARPFGIPTRNRLELLAGRPLKPKKISGLRV